MTDVWKNGREIGTTYTEPSRHRRRKFVDRRGWNPAALAGIVGPVDGQGRKCSEKPSAENGAAHDKLVTSPTVIGAASICRIGATEIRSGETGDLIGYAHLNGGVVKCVHRLAELDEQTGLRGELIAMRVVTLHGAEENLPLHSETGSGGDKLRHHIQLRTEIGCRKNGLHRGRAGQSGRKQIVVRDRAGDSVRISLFEKIVVRLREQILERLQPDVGVRAAVEAGQADAARGRNRVRNHEIADFKGICSGNGNGERNFRIAIQRGQQVGRAPAPTGKRSLFRDRCLPLDRLIGMRKQLVRYRDRFGKILGARDWGQERADVRDERHLALIKKRLHLGQAWMQSEIPAIAARQCERQKRGLRDGENATSREVGSVAAIVVRNDHIVRIVAAVKKKADQRLVIGSGDGRGT